MSPYADRAGHEQDEAITAELRSLGFDVDSVYELRNNHTDYQQAVRVLARWLPTVRAAGLKESMLRSLAVKFAKPALKAIIDDFPNAPADDPTGWQVQWAAGNAIEVNWDDRYFEDLRAISLHRGYGRGREMVVRGMGKSKHPEAAATLIGLLDDEDVLVPAILALRKVRSGDAREPLLRIRGSQERWVQQEIDRTLAKLPD